MLKKIMIILGKSKQFYIVWLKYYIINYINSKLTVHISISIEFIFLNFFKIINIVINYILNVKQRFGSIIV